MKSNDDYQLLRKGYYLGILVLILYAFQTFEPVGKLVKPLLELPIFNIPLILIIALVMLVLTYAAYFYKTIG